MGGLLERVPLPTWVSEWRPDPKSPQSRFCLGPTTNTTSTTTHLPERHLTSFSTTTSIYLLEMLPSTPGQTRRKQRRRVVFILLFTCHVVANLSKLIGLGRLTLCSVSGIFNWQNRKLQFSIILILSKDADSKKIKKQAPLDVDQPTVRATCAFACSLDRLVSPWADGGGGVIPDHCPYWHPTTLLRSTGPHSPFQHLRDHSWTRVALCNNLWEAARANEVLREQQQETRSRVWGLGCSWGKYSREVTRYANKGWKWAPLGGPPCLLCTLLEDAQLTIMRAAFVIITTRRVIIIKQRRKDPPSWWSAPSLTTAGTSCASFARSCLTFFRPYHGNGRLLCNQL